MLAGYSAAVLLGADCAQTATSPRTACDLGRQRRRGRAATLAHTNPYAGSPMESRLRMITVQAGLPPPRVQWVAQDVDARTAVWLDLAWPEHRIGVEFEGGGHTDPVEVLRNAGRCTRLVDRGWRIYRYTRFDVYGDPGRIVAELTRALATSRTA